MHRLFKIYRAYFQWTRKRTSRIFKKNPRYSNLSIFVSDCLHHLHIKIKKKMNQLKRIILY